MKNEDVWNKMIETHGPQAAVDHFVESIADALSGDLTEAEKRIDAEFAKTYNPHNAFNLASRCGTAIAV